MKTALIQLPALPPPTEDLPRLVRQHDEISFGRLWDNAESLAEALHPIRPSVCLLDKAFFARSGFRLNPPVSGTATTGG